jgi:hypothetical protein
MALIIGSSRTGVTSTATNRKPSKDDLIYWGTDEFTGGALNIHEPLMTARDCRQSPRNTRRTACARLKIRIIGAIAGRHFNAYSMRERAI